MQYILERVGWNQWMDDGGNWVGSRAAARRYADEVEAAEAAGRLNEEFAAEAGDEPQDDVVVVAA